MTVRRSTIPILAALIAALAAAPVSASHGNPFASTTLSPASQSGAVGSSFSVDIVFHDDPGSYAVEGIRALVSFDPAILQATSVTGGGSPFGTVTINTIDNTAGLIEYEASGAAVNGFTITAATVVFNAIAPGASNLRLFGVREFIVGSGPFGIDGLSVGGSIEVTSAVSEFFTDPLTGPSSPNLDIRFDKYGYTPAGLERIQSDVGADGLKDFPPPGPVGLVDRPMNRTILGGYLVSDDFVAELQVKRTVLDGPGVNDLIYFGFGEGVANPSNFDEPTNSFLFRIHSGGVGNRVDAFASPVQIDVNIGHFDPAGTTFRIERIGGDVTLSIVGQPSASRTYSVSLLGGVLDSSNGYILFGNSATGTVFSDFSVAPIPTDTTPPVVTLNGAADVTLECSVDIYTEAGATATDDQDGTVPVTMSGSVDAATPGDYTLTYSATDAAGNTGTATRTVHVVDTTAPVVTLNGAAEITLECSVDAYTEAGATAADACDGAVAVSVSGSVDASTPGDYTLTYSATDAAGNTGSATRLAHVVDTTAPTLTAALERVRGNGDDDDDHGRGHRKDDDDHGRGHRDDDDDDDDHGEDGGNRYRVHLAAADACDASPSISALIAPLDVGDASVEVRYKRHRKNSIKVQAKKHGLRVTLKGPDQAALEALWTAAVEDGGFAVQDGQVVKLVDVGGRRGDDDDDDGHGTSRFEFDGDLRLTAAFVPNPTLVAQATDASGNASDAVEVGLPSRGHGHGASKPVAAQSVQPGDSALGNYPNPFNPSTTIHYTVTESAPVRLVVYSALGQEVRELVDSHRQPGRYSVVWNGRDAGGQPVAAGVYVYRLQVGARVESGKMSLTK